MGSFFFSLLFFQCSRAHRDLHSFPTRRSSDLRASRVRLSSRSSCRLDYPRRSRRVKVAKRSEEHTSELQSRVDLVCRLLLEKKKRGKFNAEFFKEVSSRIPSLRERPRLRQFGV